MMRELKVEEMTLEQKIGHLFCFRWFHNEEEIEEICEALSRGELGAVQVNWIDWFGQKPGDVIARLKEAADNHVLICADMETGFPGSKLRIPYQMAISYADDEELAYEIARNIAIEAKNSGYSVVWSPISDMGIEGASCSNCRSFGDVERTIKCSIAMLRGFQDEGMLATMKHYPGPAGEVGDNHMRPVNCMISAEELLERNMKPYKAAIDSGDLAAIMTRHGIYEKIDNKPATFSKRILDMIREQGFDGLIFSDSLAMMAIESKYGKRESLGLAIAAGVDVVLPSFSLTYREIHDALMEAYRKGVFTEERLNDAVRHVLAAQKRTMKSPTQTELSERQKNIVDELNRKSLCAVLKDGVDVKLNSDKKKLFVLLHETNSTITVSKELVNGGWFVKEQVKKKAELIQEAFPDAKIMLINEFPNQRENEDVVRACAEAEEVIFFTFCKQTSYLGSNSLTERIKSVLEACMYKMAAIVHIGNPYEMRKFMDAPRIFLGVLGSDSERYAIQALKGEFIPTGKAPEDL